MEVLLRHSGAPKPLKCCDSFSDLDVKDGERLQLQIKDMGSCEVYPQTLRHNANGR